MKASPTSFLFVVLMSLLGALSAFATDMALPATGPMALDLAVSPGGVGLTLSAFMLSFAVSPLVYGPLSDRFGRRPVALFACLIYFAGSCGCVLAGSLPALLAWRFVQGIGGGARPLALAIIGDHFKGAAAREKMSYVGALSLLAPMLAPTIGAGLLRLGDWRFIYAFLMATSALALVLVWLKLDESLPPERRSALSVRITAAHYVGVFRSRRSLAFIVVAIAMFGVIFSYVSGSPLVMIGAFKLSPGVYGLTFMLNSAGLLVGNLVNARLNAMRVPPTVLLGVGLALVAANTAVLLAITWLGWAEVGIFLPFLFLCMVGCAIANTNAVQMAIEPLLHIAGTASAAVVSSQFGFGALAGFLVAAAYDGHSARSTVSVMAAFGLVGLAGFLMRPNERRPTAARVLSADEQRV